MPGRSELPGWFAGMGKDAGRTASPRFPCPGGYAPERRRSKTNRPGPEARVFLFNMFDLEDVGHE